jgi:hypothetical protein
MTDAHGTALPPSTKYIRSMSEGSKTRSTGVGARARAAMAAGAALEDVLHTFRTHDKLGAIGSILALREIAPIAEGGAQGEGISLPNQIS